MTSTDTIAYAIMHLTGEQARSALMLLASNHEEDTRAAVDRVQANTVTAELAARLGRPVKPAGAYRAP